MTNTITSDTRELKKIKSDSLKLIKNERMKFTVGFSIILLSIAYFSWLIANAYSATIIEFANNLANGKYAYFKTDLNNTKHLADEAVKSSVLKINSITPLPSTSPLKEDGQISAISSGRVSYTKNEYVVLKGDTLFIIAEKVYGDRDAWFRIATENNIKNPDLIEVGMTLKIPR